jgi:hypothetical protein
MDYFVTLYNFYVKLVVHGKSFYKIKGKVIHDSVLCSIGGTINFASNRIISASEKKSK